MNKSLHEAEICYLPLEKAILAVVHGTRKLPHYFQAHTVVILTQLPLKTILRSADYTRRIAKWGTILGVFNIKYMSRTSIKGQVFADLVAEFTEGPAKNESEEHRMGEKLVGLVTAQEPLQWKVYMDGATNQKGSEVGLVLILPEKLIVEKSLRLGFSAMNNKAEYEALLEGMSMVQRMGGKSATIFSDSRLVVDQVKGELEVRDERMQGYLAQIRHLQLKFESFSLQHIPRSGNTNADSLATLATFSVQNLPHVILIEDLCKPSGIRGNMICVHHVRIGPSWMDPIIQFLSKDILPEDKSEVEKIRRKAPRFWLSEDQKLYKRFFSRPYLLCIHPKVSELLLKELHEGICGSHTGGRPISHRAITQGYWWPNMQKEELEYTKKCDQC